MATIKLDFANPQLAPLQRARLPGGGLNLPRVPLALGTAAGEGMTEAGKQITAFAEAELRTVQRDEAFKGQRRVAEGLFNLQQEAAQADLRDDASASTWWAERSSRLLDEVSGSLSLDRDSMLAFRQQAEGLVLSRGFNVRQEAFQRGQQARIADTSAGLETLGNQAAMARNPVERQAVLDMGTQRIQELQETGAITPVQAQSLRDRFQTTVSVGSLRRMMAAGDLPGALAAVNDPQRTPGLDADRRMSMVLQIQGMQEARAARAEAAAARQERRIERAISEFDGMLSAGVVPADRAEAVLAMARGTPFEAGVRQRIEDGRALATFRLASPERQQAMLTEAEGRLRGGSATDRDLAFVQRMAQAADQQRRGYAQDGWQQGVRDGLIERSEIPSPLNLADPATITARFELSDRLTAARRQAVPVFSAAEVQEINRQFVAAQGNPALVAQITAAINGIPDERVRAATYRQLEAARGDAGRMEQGTLSIIGRAAAGSPAQQRAAVQMTQAVTTDRSERIRTIGEGPELRSALESALATPEMQALQATARLGRPQEVEFNAQLGIVRDLAAQHIAAGRSPSDAVRLARETVFADRLTINRPGLARVQYDAALNLGAPDVVERSLRTMRDGFASRIPLDPGLGQEANARNREILRLTRNAEWVTVAPGRFALVAPGDFDQRVILMEATADQVRDAGRGVATQRAAEAAPRAVGDRRTGQYRPPVIPDPAPTTTPETVTPSIR